MERLIKKSLYFIVSLLFLGLFLMPPTVAHGETKPAYQHVFDEAGLLSTEDMHSISELCMQYTDKNNTVFIILTHNNPNTPDGEIYMEDFYDSMVYGDSVLLLVDMHRRDVIVQAYGETRYIIDNPESQKITDSMSPYLSDDDYYNAFEVFLKRSDKFINAVPFWQNTLLHLGIALLLGGIIVGVMAYNSGGTMTTSGNTYLNQGNSGLIGRRDYYIHTKVTRAPKPKEESNTHRVSSGGHSHSSGRSKF